MKVRIVLAICAAVLLANLSPAQTVDNKAVVGVWHAQMESLPVFNMVVTDEGGSLSGAIVFYLLRREDPDQKPTATPGNPEPLLHPTFDGKSLTFQISHRRAHPPRTLNGPPVTMSFKPPEPGRPEVIQWEGKAVVITRSEY